MGDVFQGPRYLFLLNPSIVIVFDSSWTASLVDGRRGGRVRDWSGIKNLESSIPAAV